MTSPGLPWYGLLPRELASPPPGLDSSGFAIGIWATVPSSIVSVPVAPLAETVTALLPATVTSRVSTGMAPIVGRRADSDNRGYMVYPEERSVPMVCTTDGVMGKTIDAPSIVVAAAATDEGGHEGELPRALLRHNIV